MRKCEYCHRHEAIANKGRNAGLCATCLQRMSLIQVMSDKGLKYFGNKQMHDFLEAHPNYKQFYKRLTDDELSFTVPSYTINRR